MRLDQFHHLVLAQAIDRRGKANILAEQPRHPQVPSTLGTIGNPPAVVGLDEGVDKRPSQVLAVKILDTVGLVTDRINDPAHVVIERRCMLVPRVPNLAQQDSQPRVKVICYRPCRRFGRRGRGTTSSTTEAIGTTSRTFLNAMIDIGLNQER